MSELSKRYEELLELRAKATPGPWQELAATNSMNWVSLKADDYRLAVALVGFLDSLPALKKEWEWAAQRAELDRCSDWLEQRISIQVAAAMRHALARED